ncbi:MAG: phosphoglycerate dehydrogenase [Methanosarcinales archaeon]
MKVLVSDPLSEEGIEILKKEATVDLETNLTQEELINKIKEYDALVIRSGTKVTKEVIESGKKLKIIGRAGVGVDNIDIEAATKRGIIVVNAPEGNTISAAEHTIAMLLSMSRNIPQANTSLKNKEWNRKKFMGVEVCDKILGVIGLGRVGSEVAKRALGLEMKVLAYDPFISEERAKELGVKLTTVEEICKRADYITVHTPLNKDTKDLINDNNFKLMKKGVRIINCARGGIINEDALCRAIKNGIVAGAALDVFVQEPPLNSPLLDLDKVVVTPHLGASTQEAQINVAVSVAKEVLNALKGLPVKNAINMPYVKPEAMEVIKPYLSLAEKIGNLSAQLITGNYEKIELLYQGEISEKDTKPITIAALKGLLSRAFGASVNYVNAPMLAKERKIKIIESKSASIGEYPSLITFHINSDKDSKIISGTIVRKEPRIVQIDEYCIDVVPHGYMIYSLIKDHPNIIGPCCMILGKENINIASMQVGRIKVGGDAIMILNVDNEVSDDIIEEIKKVKGIMDAKLVKV